MQLGQALKLIRQTRKLSLNEVRDICGVTKSQYLRIEYGESYPFYPTLQNLAEGMEVQMWQILWLVEEMEKRTLEEWEVTGILTTYPELRMFLKQNEQPVQLSLWVEKNEKETRIISE